jgi:hypothetical protein
MFPAILAAIQAVSGLEQKKKQDRAAQQQAVAQGQAYQYPGGNVAGGLGALNTLNSAFAQDSDNDAKSEPDNDEDDRWGGMR